MTQRIIRHLPFQHFQVMHYLKEYYADLDIENEALSRFDVRILLSLKDKLNAGTSTMLDFGFGGVLATAIAAGPYLKEISIADYPNSNILQALLWQQKSGEAHKWDSFTKGIIQLEKGLTDSTSISQEEIYTREEELRKKIKHYYHCDAYKKEPLGIGNKDIKFDLVHIGFVHESIIPRIDSRDDTLLSHKHRMALWENAMLNTLKLVKDGGIVMIKALGDAQEDYPVGDQNYPTISINEDNLKKVLVQGGFGISSFETVSIPCDKNNYRGYPRMICFKAEKS